MLSNSYSGSEPECVEQIEVNEYPEVIFIREFYKWVRGVETQPACKFGFCDAREAYNSAIARVKTLPVHALDTRGLEEVARKILDHDIRSGIYLSAVHNMCPVDGFTLKHDTAVAGYELPGGKSLTVEDGVNVTTLGGPARGRLTNYGTVDSMRGKHVHNKGTVQWAIGGRIVLNEGTVKICNCSHVLVNTGAIKTLHLKKSLCMNSGSINDVTLNNWTWLGLNADDFYEQKIVPNVSKQGVSYHRMFGDEIYVNAATETTDFYRQKGTEQGPEITALLGLLEEVMTCDDLASCDWERVVHRANTARKKLRERYLPC